MRESDRPLPQGERLLILLGMFVFTPFVALLLWLLWRDTQPTKATQAAQLGTWFFGSLFALFAVALLFGLVISLLR